jgi:hypothetical protein
MENYICTAINKTGKNKMLRKHTYQIAQLGFDAIEGSIGFAGFRIKRGYMQ